MIPAPATPPPAWTAAQAARVILAQPRFSLVDRSQADGPLFVFKVRRIRSLKAAGAFRGPPANTSQPRVPIRAAFYYPWFPRNWTQLGLYPLSRYAPSLGYYSTTSPQVVHSQIRALLYGYVDAGIYSWWGQGSEEDSRFALFLAAARSTALKWAVYYEDEGYGSPTAEQIRSDLVYIRERYAGSPAYLRVDGRPVVFVYGDATDSCERTVAWQQANVIGAYLVMKVFPGFESCPVQPDGWHQYLPSTAEESFLPWSFTISPGFYAANEPAPRLERSPAAWTSEIGDMSLSNARFQLITSFNEWGEGTSVESAEQWATPSGYGAYLDALHANPTLR